MDSRLTQSSLRVAVVQGDGGRYWWGLRLKLEVVAIHFQFVDSW